MNHRSTGITVAGRQYVDVAKHCADVVECYIAAAGGVNYMLVRVDPATAAVVSPILSMPTAYTCVGNRVHLWPTPDKAYALQMSWNTSALWPTGWMAVYTAAYDAVTRSRNLSARGMHA